MSETEEIKLNREEEEAKLKEIQSQFNNDLFEISLDNISVEEKAKVDEVCNKLDNPNKLQVLQFLLMKSWNVDAAIKGINDYNEYVKENNFSEAMKNEKDNTLLKLFIKMVPGGWIGNDKKKHPVYLERTGQIMFNELVSYIDPKEFVWCHGVMMQNAIERINKQCEKNDKEFRTFTSILDLSGLSLSVRNGLGLLQASTSIDDKMYPNMLHQILILNAPWFIPGIWDLISMFLSESMKQRVRVLNDASELLDYIDADQLPKEWGGTSDIVIPTQGTTDEVMSLVKEHYGNIELSEDYIAAGEIIKQEEDLDAGDSVSWFWNIKDGYDVHFTLFVQEDGSSEAKKVEELERGVINKGSYKATKKCKVTLEFDNTFSYFYGKYLNYNISVNKAS